MWLPVLAVASVVGASVALAGLAWRRRFLFEIRVSRGGAVTLRGAVPGRSAAAVRAFVAELRLPAGARVRALPDGERFALRFSPDVPPDDRQRLRNVLYLGLP
jgi:hypothetical protein